MRIDPLRIVLIHSGLVFVSIFQSPRLCLDGVPNADRVFVSKSSSSHNLLLLLLQRSFIYSKVESDTNNTAGRLEKQNY